LVRVATVGQAVVVGLAGGMVLDVGLLFSCTPTPGTPAVGAAGQRCTRPGTPIWLGGSSPEVAPGRFTVTTGTYQLSARDFPPPAPIPLLPTDLTQAILGPGSSTPTYEWQRSTVAHAAMLVHVTKETPAVFHLDAGAYWIVNTYGVSIELTPCGGGQISGVSFPTGRLTPTTPAAAASGSR
jgi:hypothetical protein